MVAMMNTRSDAQVAHSRYLCALIAGMFCKSVDPEKLRPGGRI